MAKPRILVTRRWPEVVQARLARDYEATFNDADWRMTPEVIRQALEEHDAVLPTVSDQLPASIFPATPRARILGNFGVGHNHIDLAAARAAGLTVTNTPGCLTDCTADLAITLMLMVARRAGEGERELRAGGWTGWRPTHMMGRRLSGRTLGIIGMGRIGRATARRARLGFGMEIVFFNRSRLDDDEIRELGACQLDSVEELMEASDVVSVHCPGGGANRHLVDARAIEALGDGILVNTARGDVVDMAALMEALRHRRIAGAGLDVYENEPAVPEPLRRMENVVLLPHLGSATMETRVAMGMMVADNLDAFFAGCEPPNRVV
jgi:lactate dehydrogenase-like 2-hydroxyacid dehydrogenase